MSRSGTFPGQSSSSPALGAVQGDDTEAGLQYMENEGNRADPGTDDSRHGDGTDIVGTQQEQP